MPCVQISDSRNGYLSFDLSEILDNLESIGPTLHWHILGLEAETHPNSEVSILALERDVSTSEHGKRMTWTELTTLSKQIFQTTNCVIVGISPDKEPPSLPIDETFHEDRIIIVAFDNSWWTVCVPAAELVERLRKSFRDTRLVNHIDLA